MSKKSWTTISSGVLIFSIMKGCLLQAVRQSAANQNQVFQTPTTQVEPNLIRETDSPTIDKSRTERQASENYSHERSSLVITRTKESPKSHEIKTNSIQNEGYGDRGTPVIVRASTKVDENPSRNSIIIKDGLDPLLNPEMQVKPQISLPEQNSYSSKKGEDVKDNFSLPEQRATTIPVIVVEVNIENQEESISPQNEEAYDSAHRPDYNTTSEVQASNEKNSPNVAEKSK
jgi:hypothetical protein